MGNELERLIGVLEDGEDRGGCAGKQACAAATIGGFVLFGFGYLLAGFG